MKSIPTEREIVHRTLKGDSEAFSGIVRDYSPRMMNLALGIVQGREAAEDVVQDALVKAYEKLGTWRGDSSLSTWLYRIVYTTAVSSLRGPKGFFGDADAADRVAAMPDDEGGWEVTEHNIARMSRALEELPPLDRTMINLFYIEEKPVREVATICGENEGNVKTRLHRARARLKKLMSDE